MKNAFPQRLKQLMTQLGIPNAQLAKALNVDPSLISRWLKVGCGERKAEEHALAIERYVLRRPLTPENRAWLSSEIGRPVSAGMPPGHIAHWLYPQGSFAPGEAPEETPTNLLVVSSFHSSVEQRPAAGAPDLVSPFTACDGTDKIAVLLRNELNALGPGTVIDIFISSESSTVAIDPQILAVLRAAADSRHLIVHMLVQSANNSNMASRLISAYMPLLVQGQLTLSVIQGTPQTFTVSTNILIPGCTALIVTEAVHRHPTAVAAVIRDADVLREMTTSFENSLRFARPMMTAYNDSFARSIIEVFFEEYGVPGSLDVIKSGMNPLYMTVEQYGDVLRAFGHSEEQFAWRYSEVARFKAAMDEVLRASRFREILSISMLREIARTGRCRMPSMYFMEAGVWELNPRDCVKIFDGYIHYLEAVPDFQVMLLEDEKLFSPNSCWHIKNNKHIMIHSWNIDAPVMVYSDQLMLIDEFQKHFDRLWAQSGALTNKPQVIQTLAKLRDQCAGL